jgi:hypothetical protein
LTGYVLDDGANCIDLSDHHDFVEKDAASTIPGRRRLNPQSIVQRIDSHVFETYVLAVSAAGAVATAARAAPFGNPGQPPQGAINAKAPEILADPVPHSAAIGNQFPSAQFPLATDVGGMPMDGASFNNASKRVQNGGWPREVTQPDFVTSSTSRASICG